MGVRICHVSTVHSAFDDRIFYKECTSLAKAGFDVSLVINHTTDEVVNGVRIIALKPSSNRLFRILIKPLIAMVKVLKTRSKIVHFHDPELIFVGILLALLNKKVIYDAHENVPAQILSKTYIKPSFLRKLIAFAAKTAEHFGTLFFAAVISVIPEITHRFPEKKRLLIRNLPLLSLSGKSETAIDRPLDKTVVVYAGGLSRIRGIKEVIQAIAGLPQIEFWLIGTWAEEAYYEECRQSKGWEKVRYFGQKKLEDVFSYIKAADIGICILHPEPNYLHSLPVKAFEYMACNKPIVMSDFPYWQKVFANCALFVSPFEIDDIAKNINYLAVAKKTAEQLGKNGKQLVRTEYSWEAEQKKLIAFYHKLAS